MKRIRSIRAESIGNVHEILRKWKAALFFPCSHQWLIRQGIRELYFALFQQYEVMQRKAVERFSRHYAKDTARNAKTFEAAVVAFKKVVKLYREARVVRVLALGLMLMVQPSAGLTFTPDWPFSIPDDAEPRNAFATTSELCQPTGPVENPQVVRVFTLSAIPGPKPGTVLMQSQACSGVVIGPRTVLTAKHCLESDLGGRLILSYVKTITEQTHAVHLRSPDPLDDIVMLTVSEPFDVHPAPISPRNSLSTAPLSLQGYGCQPENTNLPVKRTGSALYILENQLYLSGCICHGDSGGPVFDSEGRLVAVMIRTDNRGLAGRALMVHDFLNHP